MVALALFFILALIISTKIVIAPKGAVEAAIGNLTKEWNKIIEPHRAVLRVLCYVFISLFVLGRLTEWSGDFFEFPALIKFAEYCRFFGWFAGGAILLVLAGGAQAQERERLCVGVAALLSPKKIMKIKTGDIYGPAAFLEHDAIH